MCVYFFPKLIERVTVRFIRNQLNCLISQIAAIICPVKGPANVTEPRAYYCGITHKHGMGSMTYKKIIIEN